MEKYAFEEDHDVSTLLPVYQPKPLAKQRMAEIAEKAVAIFEDDPLGGFLYLKQIAEICTNAMDAIKTSAINAALTETGGDIGRETAIGGANISVRNLPPKYEGYSDEVLKLENEAKIVAEKVKAQKKIEQLNGTAIMTEHGCTLQVKWI